MHETIEALSAYVDNEVSTSDRARIEAHLASCSDCTSRKALLEHASASVQSLPPIAPTADESRRIRQGVLGRTERKSLFPGRVRPAWAGAGALALVVAGVVAGAGLLRDGKPRDTTTAARRGSAPTAAAFNTPEEVRSFVESDEELRRAYRAVAPAGSGAEGAAPSALRDNARQQSEPTGALAPLAGDAADKAEAARSAEECRAAQKRSQAVETRPVLTREATWQGSPAWLLVDTASDPPAGGGRLFVYVVGRSDCELLTYQFVRAP